MTKEFICIVCPRGCHVTVDDLMNISGNQCIRGKTYVLNEMKNPKRVLTTTVRTVFEEMPRVSVKTTDAIPKELLYQAMELINQVVITREMDIHDIVIENILDSGVNVILTKEIKLSKK
jgi:CxxC motif-containing protein